MDLDDWVCVEAGTDALYECPVTGRKMAIFNHGKNPVWFGPDIRGTESTADLRCEISLRPNHVRDAVEANR
jgi:hypothetical protein